MTAHSYPQVHSDLDFFIVLIDIACSQEKEECMFFFRLMFLSVFYASLVFAEGTLQDGLSLLDEEVAHEYVTKLSDLQNTEAVCRIDMTPKHPQVFTDTEAVTHLDLEMLTVLQKMHWQLENDQSFRNNVAALIERDLNDVDTKKVIATEFGGLGLLVDGEFELLPIPSGGELELSSYKNRLGHNVTVFGYRNASYDLPNWAVNQIPHIFSFHLHAVSRSPAYESCIPSFGYASHSSNGLSGDIGNAAYNTEVYGRTHQFLFAKMKNESFSTVYMGGAMRDGKWFISVVALPTYSY